MMPPRLVPTAQNRAMQIARVFIGRIHTVPRPIKSMRCQLDHASRSSRAGTLVTIVLELNAPAMDLVSATASRNQLGGRRIAWCRRPARRAGSGPGLPGPRGSGCVLGRAVGGSRRP
jgi:hypothetical protein